MPDNPIHKVGYKNPPEHTRFKPGRSGNAAGRPKGTLNIRTDLQEELSERIAIREGDRSLKVSKQRALLKSMLAKALKGDIRAANTLLHLISKIMPAFDATSPGEQEPLSPDEAAIVERFIARRISDGNDKSVSTIAEDKENLDNE